MFTCVKADELVARPPSILSMIDSLTLCSYNKGSDCPITFHLFSTRWVQGGGCNVKTMLNLSMMHRIIHQISKFLNLDNVSFERNENLLLRKQLDSVSRNKQASLVIPLSLSVLRVICQLLVTLLFRKSARNNERQSHDTQLHITYLQRRHPIYPRRYTHDLCLLHFYVYDGYVNGTSLKPFIPTQLQ